MKHEKKETHKGIGKKAKRLIPLAAVCTMAVIFRIITSRLGEPLTADTVLKYSPDNPVLAAAVMILFFAIKSLTIVFPLSVLYLASGIMFSPIPAVLVSSIGLAAAISIPYWIGRYSGDGVVKEISEKYPKVGQVEEYQRQNSFFACFITRIVGILPGDIVSIYFGACETPYPVYLAAGLCGSMLSIVTTTLLGEKLNNPFSAEFLVVLLCRILVSVGSVAVNYKLNMRKKKEQ